MKLQIEADVAYTEDGRFILLRHRVTRTLLEEAGPEGVPAQPKLFQDLLLFHRI